jgi:hypothetical protein
VPMEVDSVSAVQKSEAEHVVEAIAGSMFNGTCPSCLPTVYHGA